MIGFYTAIDKLKAHFDADPLVNSISEGDIFQVDLAKQTIFPLVHIMVNSCSFETNVLRFNISLIAMDLVDISKNGRHKRLFRQRQHARRFKLDLSYLKPRLRYYVTREFSI
jgi:hypothetical protein